MKEFYHCFNLSHGNSISDRDYVTRVKFHDVLMGSPLGKDESFAVTL